MPEKKKHLSGYSPVKNTNPGPPGPPPLRNMSEWIANQKKKKTKRAYSPTSAMTRGINTRKTGGARGDGRRHQTWGR